MRKDGSLANLQDTIRNSAPHGANFDLTRLDYPIVLAEPDDWGQYIDEWRTGWTGDPEPATPGIAVINLEGAFYAIRHGSYDSTAGRDWTQNIVDELLGGPVLVQWYHVPHYQVTMPEWARTPAWWKVAYLIIGPGGWRNERVRDLVKAKPGARFSGMVEKYVESYIRYGELPPAEIVSPILNIADDVIAGREVTLKAGDYIALQTHFRRKIGGPG